LCRCELLVDTKKLRFYDNDEQEGDPFVLELSGCGARTLDARHEREFAFEIYGRARNNTLEKLACTTERDLEQWLSILAEVNRVSWRGALNHNIAWR
jgi:hypothetical protein